ncbi:MAG: hypothetical protein JW973_16760 [Bacteroidales bacterium]|nr:hypothetical protein [Bacteroidales bacterium]
MKNVMTILAVFVVFVLASCRKTEPAVTTEIPAMGVTDSAAGILVAENIIQDIIIKNNDPDNYWAAECLKGMHRKALVDIVFDLAYSQKALVYDFDTNEKLTVRQLKQFEKKEGFSRDKIGKIQFVESWYLNPDKVSITKKVSSIVLGYEINTNEGIYFPVFRMILN